MGMISRNTDLVIHPTHRRLLIVAGFVLLFSALIEYGLGVMPCKLCLYQRFAWLATAFLAPLSLPYFRTANILCAVSLSAGLIAAIYQVLLERGAIVENVCTPVTPLFPVLAKALGVESSVSVVVSCGEPALRYGVISLASVNVLITASALVAIIRTQIGSSRRRG